MRKIVLSFLALTLVVAATASAQITGSKHDFTQAPYSLSEICKACHIPHEGATNFAAPLWNHTITTATYTRYTSGTSATYQATNAADLGDISKACMSCHDGTVNIDAFGGGIGEAAGAGTVAIAATGLVGTDISNDHPVSFTYNAALETADGELATPNNTTGVVGTDSLPLFGTGHDQVECASCHDVHNGTNLTDFLLVANTGSALCLNCHEK